MTLKSVSFFWSIQGGLLLSPSQWTLSSTPCAERRNIPYSTLFFLMWPDLHALIARQTREAYLTIIGLLIWTEVCQTHGNVLHILHWRQGNFLLDFCGPGERLTNVQTTCRPDHVWPEVWSKIGKNKNGQLTKAKIGQCSTIEWNLFHSSKWCRISGDNEKCKEKTGNPDGTGFVL